MQHHKRQTGQDRYELISAEAGKGFARLPMPDPGDLFFDMEGDPLHPEGLEYLFGLHYLAPAVQPSCPSGPTITTRNHGHFKRL